MDTRDLFLWTLFQKLEDLRKKKGMPRAWRIRTACLVCMVLLGAFLVSGGSSRLIAMEQMSLSDQETSTVMVQAAEQDSAEDPQAGLMGVMDSAKKMQDYAEAAREVTTASASEEILVGASSASRTERQRSSMGEAASSAGELFAEAKQVVRSNQMSSDEYYTLLQIVEAEATGEDQDGKCLIANVILNRVRDSRFPDTIQEVVYQQVDGSAQFQPTVDGRMYSVEITEDTIQAVDRALAGEDNSQGALYFMARNASEDASIGWFEENLVWLFQHGGHEYYTIA